MHFEIMDAEAGQTRNCCSHFCGQNDRSLRNGTKKNRKWAQEFSAPLVEEEDAELPSMVRKLSSEAGQYSTMSASSFKFVIYICRAWLMDYEHKIAARFFFVTVSIYWVVRELLWAFFISKLQANLINTLTTLHETGDMSKFYWAVFACLCSDLFVDIPLFHICDPWVRTWFICSLRNSITSGVLGAYVCEGGQSFYRIKVQEGTNGIDNPDQRIAEDVRTIAERIYGIYASILSSIFGCGSWAIVIFTVGGKTVFITAVVTACVRMTVAFGCFGDRIVRATKWLEKTTADYRYGLIRTRENAEGIAVIGAEETEYDRVDGLFQRNMTSLRHLIWLNMLYDIAMSTIVRFPGRVIWTCFAPKVASGEILIGDVVRVCQGYDQLVKVLDFLSLNFSTLMTLKSDSERLGELWQECARENLKKGRRGPLASYHHWSQKIIVSSIFEGKLSKFFRNSGWNWDADKSKMPDFWVERVLKQKPVNTPPAIYFEDADEDVAFALKELIVMAPGSNLRVGGASCSCRKGEAILISGNSGLGKSSILRCLGGLWVDGTGAVQRDPKAEVFCLPQVPYTPCGSLLEAVVYPNSEESVVEELGVDVETIENLARDAFARTSLSNLLDIWSLRGSKQDWPVILSAGEKQRIGFARTFFRMALSKHLVACGGKRPNPILLILDESTSGLDIAVEAHIYNELLQELKSNELVAIVSVGHRPTLPKFHDSELKIGGLSPTDLAHPDYSSGHDSVLASGKWHTPAGDEVPWCHVLLRRSS